jgi:hypothetical protein
VDDGRILVMRSSISLRRSDGDTCAVIWVVTGVPLIVPSVIVADMSYGFMVIGFFGV